MEKDCLQKEEITEEDERLSSASGEPELSLPTND